MSKLTQGKDVPNDVLVLICNFNTKGHPEIFSAGGPLFSLSGRGHIIIATDVSVKDDVNTFTFNDLNKGTSRTLPFSDYRNATDDPQGGSFM